MKNRNEGRGLVLSWTVLAIAISLVSAVSATAQKKDDVTEKNWEQHPKIAAIRKIVSVTNAGLKKGSFRIAKRGLWCGGEYESDGTVVGGDGKFMRIARDVKGAVKWYEDSAGGEDSVWTYRYYYDPQSRLRFIHVTIGAVNGTRSEDRVYFDENGTLIWHAMKLLEGPGYFHPQDNDLKEMAKMDPAKDFAETPKGCKKEKWRR